MSVCPCISRRRPVMVTRSVRISERTGDERQLVKVIIEEIKDIPQKRISERTGEHSVSAVLDISVPQAQSR